MMDSSGRDILGDVTHSGKTTILEGSSQESVKNCIDSNSEGLLDEGKRSSSKGKARVHDMPPPSPSNAKRLFHPLISGEFCQDNAGDKNKETDQSGLSSFSFGLIPGHCNESEDISTESDEALEDNYERDSADVTGNLSHMVYGLPLSSSHDYNVDFLSLKEIMVDGCGNLTQELLDNIGLGKPCSCSFCLKEVCYPSLVRRSQQHGTSGASHNAVHLIMGHMMFMLMQAAAHMWMDLTFQDTRGRLIELQKSKKRAADQVSKATQGLSKLSKSTKLEFDLMQNWKSIFIRTQDALAREIAETRSDLHARSKLMENCKRELASRSSALRYEP